MIAYLRYAPALAIAVLCAACIALWGYAKGKEADLANARDARDAAIASAKSWERLYYADISKGDPDADANWLSQRGGIGPSVQGD